MVHYRLTAKLNEQREIWYGIHAVEGEETVAQAEDLSQDSCTVRNHVKRLNQMHTELADFLHQADTWRNKG